MGSPELPGCYFFLGGKLHLCRLDVNGSLRVEPVAQPRYNFLAQHSLGGGGGGGAAAAAAGASTSTSGALEAKSNIVSYNMVTRSCPTAANDCSFVARGEEHGADCASESSPRKKQRKQSNRGAFSVSQKAAIVRKKREQSWMKLADLAEWFNKEFDMPPPKLASICEILKQGDKWVELADTAMSDSVRNKMKVRKGNVEALDKALLEWYRENTEPDTQISNAVIISHAKRIAQDSDLPKTFNFSRKWLLLWKKKSGLIQSSIKH